MNSLKDTFIELASNYIKDNTLTHKLWAKIEENHSKKGRHYHTLDHLKNLLLQLLPLKNDLKNWNTVLFSLFYHDIVYNPLSSNNEEESALFAEKCMKHLSVPIKDIELCKNQILATKSHAFSTDMDTNYFTDADLSILGQSHNTYLLYCQNVRAEYAVYPDLIYNAGRQKVLKHFLSMPRIYKTDYFYNIYEAQAKSNLQMEAELLSSR
jgi:predicted metal-dependent HD superfamily phosphohydrolase